MLKNTPFAVKLAIVLGSIAFVWYSKQRLGDKADDLFDATSLVIGTAILVHLL